jgi:hypothetical protein
LPAIPGNLVLWMRFPRNVKRGMAILDFGVSEREARDVATYAYALL